MFIVTQDAMPDFNPFDPVNYPNKDNKISSITGTLSVPRHAMAERIQQAGGKVADAVTKSVTLLVTGTDPSAAKVRKAQDFGILTLSEAELLARLEGVAPAAPSESTAGALRQGELPL